MSAKVTYLPGLMSLGSVMRNDVPWRDQVVDTPLVIADGHVVPAEQPGSGMEIDEDAAARYPTNVSRSCVGTTTTVRCRTW
jgi:L-alanine-DL-glutamate epimerase-like enolase superfamily enzyme